MTGVSTQPACPPLPQRLQQRLAALGLAVFWVDGRGHLQPHEDCGWFERQLATSPLFATAVQRCWPRLQEAQGAGVEVWPGAWVVALPLPRRRRSGPDAGVPQGWAALLLGPAILDSEQLRGLCDAAHLDFAATLARARPAAVISDAEAARLAAALGWMQQDTLEIERRHTEIQGLSQQLGESYEELSLLYKLSTSMSVNQPPAQFLTDACRELQQVLGLKWMALALTQDEPRLNELGGQCFACGPVGEGPGVLRGIARELIAAQVRGGLPLVVEETGTLGIPHLPDLAACIMVIPLLREGRPLGILFGGDKVDGSHISSVDSKLCASLANSLSILLQNVMLYEDMQAMFMGTLHALTSSIDAKDSYTHGHSERVALLSRQLAVAAGIEPATVERIYISALVHDVGKIGVPEAVLSKPGYLSEEEFNLIKLHPQIGARILQDIRQMQDLIPGVLYHHERWDARGYPFGLGGESIPLFGRLICLADSYDAMSSNRTYRQAMGPQQVLAEISRCAGTQFDPALARLFVKLDFQPVSQLIQKHQQAHEARLREAARSTKP